MTDDALRTEWLAVDDDPREYAPSVSADVHEGLADDPESDGPPLLCIWSDVEQADERLRASRYRSPDSGPPGGRAGPSSCSPGNVPPGRDGSAVSVHTAPSRRDGYLHRRIAPAGARDVELLFPL